MPGFPERGAQDVPSLPGLPRLPALLRALSPSSALHFSEAAASFCVCLLKPPWQGIQCQGQAGRLADGGQQSAHSFHAGGADAMVELRGGALEGAGTPASGGLPEGKGLSYVGAWPRWGCRTEAVWGSQRQWCIYITEASDHLRSPRMEWG